MSLLSNLKSDGLEQQEDRLGGFSLRTTGLYPAKVKLAYVTKAPSGAMAVNLTFDIGGQEYREAAIYITNKAGENFYYTKDDKGNPTKNKAQLPGFNLVNNLCRLSVDQELSELDSTVEEKTIKLYDRDEKKEIPKSVPVITGLLGAEILLAIVEQTVNKTEKNDNTGNYDPIAESRDENYIEHVFHLDTRGTVNEISEGKEPEFATKWEAQYGGKKRDKRTIKDGESAPKSGRPTGSAPQASGEKKTSSLFKR